MSCSSSLVNSNFTIFENGTDCKKRTLENGPGFIKVRLQTNYIFVKLSLKICREHIYKLNSLSGVRMDSRGDFEYPYNLFIHNCILVKVYSC